MKSEGLIVRLWLSGLCACLVIAAGASAGAQTQPTPTERLTALHDALHLTAAQEDAWRVYTTALQPTRDALARRQATQQLISSLPTPRRIALIDATMEQDLQDMRAHGDAVVAFYDRLSPDQQRTFDRQTLPSQGPAPAN